MIMTLPQGTHFGHYEIGSQLGAGGMGEVYLARDVKLERSVALKILPAELAVNEDRMRRFTLEARAAAALNHPNIAHIYEIGEVNEIHFIAMEYVEGETLRAFSRGAKLPVDEALDIGVQAAAALAIAHAAGIIHRDIKPENIMIRPDRLVKVLDFGLAKLTETNQANSDPEAPTLAHVKTEPGMIMGTVAYMSPEQARGKAVDARSDIWSLGCVLYEMVAGRAPFAGETTADRIAATIHKQPVPLSRVAENVPTRLEEIISKCLEKEADERYQTTKDLLIDLRRLKKRLEFEAESERTQSPEDARAADEQESQPTQMLSAARTDTAQARTNSSSAQILVSEIKRHKIGFALALTAFILLLAAGVFGLYKFVSQAPPASQAAQKNSPAFQAMKITKLTDTGKAGNMAISPDGKYVVHVQIDGGKQSLWMRHVATDSNVQIIAPAEVGYWRLTFSRDGDHIYFVRYDSSELEGALYRIPVLGGEPEKLLSGIASPVAFSPDGKQFAFVRQLGSSGDENVLVIANADGANEHQIAKREPLEGYFCKSGPSWSPDGKRIALCIVTTEGNKLVEVKVEGGAVNFIGQESWSDIGRVAWLPDGSGLLATAQAKGSPGSQIYLFSYPGGEARRITNDTNDYADLSLTTDASAFVTSQRISNLNLWTLPLSSNAAQMDEAHARQITSGENHAIGVAGLAALPDGKIIYTSWLNGNLVLWACNPDGTNPKRLAEEMYIIRPAVTPDGKFIVLDIVGKNGKYDNIWRINADGSNPVKLTNGEDDETPSVTPDGRFVIYDHWEGGTKASVWRVPIEGGEAVPIIDKQISEPLISPDGKRMVGWYRENKEDNYKPVLLPFDAAGGEPKLTPLELPLTSRGEHWTPDGKALAYLIPADGNMNIWTLPLAGGKSQQLTNFKSQMIQSFAFAADGKSLILSRGTMSNDVVLISNFK